MTEELEATLDQLEKEVLYGGDKLVHGSGGISQLRAA